MMETDDGKVDEKPEEEEKEKKKKKGEYEMTT